MSAVGIACVAQSLRYGEIGVVELDVLANRSEERR